MKGKQKGGKQEEKRRGGKGENIFSRKRSREREGRGDGG